MFDEVEYCGQIFENFVLAEVDVRFKNFERCVFKRCDFSGCDFVGSEFSDCVFDHCTVSLGKFVDCGFRDVVFKHSKLIGVDLSKCSVNFFDLGFEKCLIETCGFSGLPMSETVFEECVIRECGFGEANLSKAVFDDCDLEGTLFHGAKLDGANFSRARNYTINPASNSIKGAKFSLPEAVSLLGGFDIELV